MRIGVGIVTCDRPEYLSTLLNSLPKEHENKIDHLVIVNDGTPVGNFDLSFGEWLHNEINLGVGKSKNRAMQHLLNKGCDYIFIIEDDMVIVKQSIFNTYIDAHLKTGIHHFMFGYHGPANKGGVSGGNPTPRKIIDYGDIKIALNLHCVGAFCFYTKKCLEDVGLNDERYINAFEHVDHSFMLAKKGYSTPYWWWADIANSLDYINEQACSEVSSSIKPRPDWGDNIVASFKYFSEKNGIAPTRVPDTNISDIIQFLKSIKPVK